LKFLQNDNPPFVPVMSAKMFSMFERLRRWPGVSFGYTSSRRCVARPLIRYSDRVSHLQKARVSFKNTGWRVFCAWETAMGGKMKSISLFGALATLLLIAMPASADDVAEGKALYLQYCASCHGPNGEGNGPLARVLTTPPYNLRMLSQRFGNPIPEEQIAKFIDGREDVRAHGPRDMPVWGERFSAETGDQAKTRARIKKLTAFLQSIQTGGRTAMRSSSTRLVIACERPPGQ
jgi:mono/diheme cytochrome c family protein